jgi:ATP-dependent Lon protease
VAADRADRETVVAAARLIGAAAMHFVLLVPLEQRHEAQQLAGWSSTAWALISAGMRPICDHGRESDDLIKLAQDYVKALRDSEDQIKQARRRADKARHDQGEPNDRSGSPDGIVVIDKVGGLSTTSSGRDAVKAFEAMAGVHIPRIRTPPLAAVRAALCAEFPYAVDVIETLLLDLALGEFVRFRPTVVVGAFGIGKSRLVRRMGALMHVPVGRFDAASAFDSAFGGTSRRWATGEPCFPLMTIKTTNVSNPIVMLDELDKAGGSDHNGRLDMALLPFLERETAARYPDPFVQAACDLSWVSYIATANDDARLPAMLKDRLRVLRIPMPDRAHLPALAATMVMDLVREHDLDPRWASPLGGEELEIAARMWNGASLRRLRRVIERLIAQRGRAVARH